MGRSLDVLSRGRMRVIATIPADMPAPMPIRVEKRVELPKEPIDETDFLFDDDDVPFIEVGGPRSKVEFVEKAATPQPQVNVPEPAVATPPAPMKSAWFHPESEPHYLSILYQPVNNGIALPEGAHPFSTELVAHHRPEHAISGQYRSVWREISARLVHPHQALLFTTTQTESGTTTVLINMAVTILRDPGKKVLLIEANPGRPAMATRLGLPTTPGMHEYMHRGMPLALSVRRTALPGLSLLAAGHGEGNRGEIDRDRLAKLLAQLRAKFDWVLIDAPVWSEEGVGEWLALCDAAYLVLRQGQGDEPDVESAHERLQRDDKLRGYVLTRG